MKNRSYKNECLAIFLKTLFLDLISGSYSHQESLYLTLLLKRYQILQMPCENCLHCHSMENRSGLLLATSEQSREATASQRGWTNSCRYMCVYVYQWVCRGTCRVLGHRGRKVALHRRGLTALTLQIHSPPTHSALNPSANPDKDRDYWNHHHLGCPTCPLVGGTLENTEHTLSTYDHLNRH